MPDPPHTNRELSQAQLETIRMLYPLFKNEVLRRRESHEPVVGIPQYRISVPVHDHRGGFPWTPRLHHAMVNDFRCGHIVRLCGLSDSSTSRLDTEWPNNN